MKNELTIGVIGQGFVGSSIKEGLKNDYPNLLTYDVKPELSMCNSLAELVSKCYFLFVCIPTPMKSTGECYTGFVEEVVKQISELTDKRDVILKTTVPPGTTSDLQEKFPNLNLVFNPEFLTEANAVNDFKNKIE
jgi:UDP-glucose 6-dehydrogenase